MSGIEQLNDLNYKRFGLRILAPFILLIGGCGGTLEGGDQWIQNSLDTVENARPADGKLGKIAGDQSSNLCANGLGRDANGQCGTNQVNVQPSSQPYTQPNDQITPYNNSNIRQLPDAFEQNRIATEQSQQAEQAATEWQNYLNRLHSMPREELAAEVLNNCELMFTPSCNTVQSVFNQRFPR